MSRKNLILIAVIVVMLGGSAIILYRGFFSQPSAPSSPVAGSNTVADSFAAKPPGTENVVSNINSSQPAATGSGEAVTAASPLDSAKILPYGSRFDLTLIKKYNTDTRTNNYPVVQPEEVGPALNALVQKKP
jgi:hypothetical protein